MPLDAAAAAAVALASVSPVMDVLQAETREQMMDAIVRAGAGLIESAFSEIRANGKEPESKVDRDTAVQIAQLGGLKHGDVQALWKELLRTALDPSRPFTVTKDDIDLLNGMEPFQALLVHVLYKYGQLMCKQAMDTPSWSNLYEPERVRAKCLVSAKMLFEFCRNDFGSIPAIGIDDLCYLIQSRLDTTREKVPKPLFHLLGISQGNRWNERPDDFWPLMNSSGDPTIDENTIFSLRLTFPALQLARKIVDIKK